MKFPTCPEVCVFCRDRKHIFHTMNELGDMWAQWEYARLDGEQPHKYIKIYGYAEDELWLDSLLRNVFNRVKRDEDIQRNKV